jgi:hypothetical protein
MGWMIGMQVIGSQAEKYGVWNQAWSERSQIKLEERQEKLAAGDRELQRQRRLNALLGEQNAMAAASGVANSGSVANISLQDAKLAEEDSKVDKVNTGYRLQALRMKRKSILRGAHAWTIGHGAKMASSFGMSSGAGSAGGSGGAS